MEECEFEKDGKCYAGNCFNSRLCRAKEYGEPNFVTEKGEPITMAKRKARGKAVYDYYSGWTRGTLCDH
ncbi:hypothetical protein LCGC14_0560900 [marine sediment metagenome]|uniref:Uncharacterized protein n=1 Tax=marine sediment metagenome TaxID=412755 RepID=A0A0F9RS42_9ZZZZ